MTGQRAPLPPDPDAAFEERLAAYLRQHPDFFERHDALLVELRVPHVRGGAVSLVERQIDLLRAQNSQYREQIRDLITVARANDHLSRRLHRLTLAMIDAADLTEVLNILEDHLHEEFRADAVELRLFPAARMRLALESDAAAELEMIPFLPLFRARRPQCGHPTPAQLSALFNAQAADLGSAALLPLIGDDIMGVLAIGSADPRRFHPDMGTELLVRLGEIVARKLQVVSLPGV